MFRIGIEFLGLFIERLVDVFFLICGNIKNSICGSGVVMTVIMKCIVCVWEENMLCE
jgi:hypothetical protein